MSKHKVYRDKCGKSCSTPWLAVCGRCDVWFSRETQQAALRRLEIHVSFPVKCEGNKR